MRYCLLASGSNANACYVETPYARLLIDVGLGIRELTRRLGELGVDPEEITDVLITHEHGDHIGGLGALIKRQPELRIFATRATVRHLPFEAQRRSRAIRPARALTIGDLTVLPFPVAHDAADTVGYRVEGQGATLGYCTDLGSYSRATVAGLEGAHALIVESNHCPQLLERGPYPAHLKRRVAGRLGHLSNGQARRLIEHLVHSQLRHVTLAHLSGVNNTPEQLRETLGPLMRDTPAIEWSIGDRRQALPEVTLGAEGHALRRKPQQMDLFG